MSKTPLPSSQSTMEESWEQRHFAAGFLPELPSPGRDARLPAKRSGRVSDAAHDYSRAGRIWLPIAHCVLTGRIRLELVILVARATGVIRVRSLQPAFAPLGACVASLRLPIGMDWMRRPPAARRHPCARPSLFARDGAPVQMRPEPRSVLNWLDCALSRAAECGFNRVPF